MKGLLFKTQYAMESQIMEFLGLLGKSMLSYREALDAYLKEDNSVFETKVRSLVQTEKNMDNLRVDVVSTMYDRSLIPDSREDILELLELLDKIPGAADDGIEMIKLQQPNIPQMLHADLLNFVKHIQVEIESIAIATTLLFKDLYAVRKMTDDVIEAEAEADKLEFALLRKVFQADLPLAHKLQLKAIIGNLANIADLGEEVAQTIFIFATKRVL